MASQSGSVEKSGLAKVYRCFTTINNFQSVSRNIGIIHVSQHSFVGPSHDYNWSINLHNQNSSSEYFSVVAILTNSSFHSDENFILEFSLLGVNDKKYFVRLVPLTKGEGKVKVFIMKNELQAAKSSLLPNNQARLLCQIFDTSYIQSWSTRRGFSANLLLEGFDRLLDSEKFSDFKLAVKGKEFRVHRAILAARSPVFEAMFESEMRETSEKKADIEDVEPKIMEKMLRFIYTGEVDFGDSAEQVLVAAEKYQLESLKFRCENELAKGLTIANVYDVLLLADQNNATQLTRMAIEFFDRNAKELVASENFKVCINSLPTDLKTDIIYIIALNR